MNKKDFSRWFNKDFWEAFRKKTFPIEIPISQKEKEELIDSVYKSIISVRYAASIPEAEIIINKGYGVARTVPVFCIEDYCVYYFCIKELEDVLCVNRTDNTFGGWSLGGKIRKKEYEEIECELTEYGRYSFNPQTWTQAFGEFNSLLFSQIDRSNYSHILQLDLSNFYDSVRLDILERWIREASDAKKGWIVTLLFYFLNHWNRRNTGLHPQTVGLPQDALADCSRILANYYLQKYDEYAAKICLNLEALYFRYADDQMILLNNPENVDTILLLLTRNLDKYGLRVNQKKVMIWKAEQLQEHRCRSIQSIFAEKGDNKKSALVKQFVEGYLALHFEELEKSWNSGLPLLNRLLWSDLESLPEDLFEIILQRFTSDIYISLADQKKLERVNNLNKKCLNPIDFEYCLRKIGEKSVHNAYHYEALAFANNARNLNLATYFKGRIEAIEEMCGLLSGRTPKTFNKEKIS